jgi:uroporphyrin-III C-methyltransferase/precorrin-2 dehydrogenase/sirohydrochlorin ferrochelatase
MKKVYLIGAGPGDPELITLKAIRALGESDAVLYDHLINPEILRHCKNDAEFIFVGKSKGDHTLPQEEINTLIVDLIARHNTVSRVKGGDPYIFGRGGEEFEFVINSGIYCEVIPGITSASGASTSCHIPLTHRDYASEVIFITGHKKKEGDFRAFSSLDLKRKTYVIYMAVSSVSDIVEEIIKKPENRKIPVAVVEKATLKNQRVITGIVENISELIAENNIQAPALIILGEVVNFHNRVREIMKKFETPIITGK